MGGGVELRLSQHLLFLFPSRALSEAPRRSPFSPLQAASPALAVVAWPGSRQAAPGPGWTQVGPEQQLAAHVGTVCVGV